MEWPKRFYERKRGEGCPICEQGRPDETAHGIRFFSGELTDAYLSRGGVQRVKMNYDILGNSVPHLHVHLVPRYADDPRPEWPFPFPEEDPPPFPDDEVRADAERLRVSCQASLDAFL